MNYFMQQLCEREEANGSVLCVGLDSAPDKLPGCMRNESDPQLAFNQKIIDSTCDLVSCYKPNLAFYMVRGADGIQTLKQTIAYAHKKNVPVILDAKLGDIGNTAVSYAKSIFEEMNADAVTLNPYMGEQSIEPFRAYQDCYSYILCFTSNESRKDFQTKTVHDDAGEEIPLYEMTARHIVNWNHEQNLGAVVGATAPEELAGIRKTLGKEVSVLSPGLGAQGGDLEEVLWSGYSGPGSLVLNVSRSVIFASKDDDFADAARHEADMLVQQMRVFLTQYKENRK
jgi:orotidine-5'-phosphate decarboxylase